MKLYAERRVNPLKGCLPIHTIEHFETLESFRTGGLLWFPDLNVSDPIFILTIIYVLTMLAAQKMATRNTAPEQKRIMRLLPMAFGFFLPDFPFEAVLVLHLFQPLTLIQNYLIYHRISFVSGREEIDES